MNLEQDYSSKFEDPEISVLIFIDLLRKVFPKIYKTTNIAEDKGMYEHLKFTFRFRNCCWTVLYLAKSVFL
jgi:hypothetical protein